jgi:hypothetical protein
MPQNLIADVKQKFTADSVMAVLKRQACRIGGIEVILNLRNMVNIALFEGIALIYSCSKDVYLLESKNMFFIIPLIPGCF